MNSSTVSSNTPLKDIVVVSAAGHQPGSYATLLLADLGAEVILIERPGDNDPTRYLPVLFDSLNRSKKSICLNLKDETDQSKLHKLIRRADVFVEGYRPGTVERLGLSYPVLSKIKNDLIYVSISGHGQDGPYRDRPAHDLSCQGIGGGLFPLARALKGEEPGYLPISDLTAGMFAALGILAALYGRKNSSKGCYIDTSMTETVASLMTSYLYAGMNGETLEDIREPEPAYTSFVCRDKKMVTVGISEEEDVFWNRLCQAFGMDDVADLLHPERTKRVTELRSRLADIFQQYTREELGEIFDQWDIPWGPLHDLADVGFDPHLVARGMFPEVMNPHNGRLERFVALPMKFSNYDTATMTHPPAAGEHSAEILASLEEPDKPA